MQDFFNKIEWSPTIGDPSFVGWFTVFVYIIAGIMSLRVYRKSERIFVAPIARQKKLWLAIGILSLLLGINKQLDLQTFFTASARYFSMEQGWYGNRKLLQKAFILSIATIGFVSLCALVVYFFRVITRHILAIIGLCCLMVFVLARATSFHYMDIFISLNLFGIFVNWLLELTGIGLILYNARKLYRQRRPLYDITAPKKDQVEI